MEWASVVGVTEAVGDVGAGGEVDPGVDIPGVLTSLVRVEQLVQTSSPVELLSLLTPPICAVQFRHPPLLEGEDVGLVSPQVE